MFWFCLKGLNLSQSSFYVTDILVIRCLTDGQNDWQLFNLSMLLLICFFNAEVEKFEEMKAKHEKKKEMKKKLVEKNKKSPITAAKRIE